MYDESCLRESRPKPLRSVLSLTTGVDGMCFNHSGEVLALSSSKKKNALKLVRIWLAAWTYVVVCGLSCFENVVAAGPCAVTVCVLQLAIDEDLTSLCLCNGFLPH